MTKEELEKATGQELIEQGYIRKVRDDDVFKSYEVKVMK
jgi:hypothetical protein